MELKSIDFEEYKINIKNFGADLSGFSYTADYLKYNQNFPCYLKKYPVAISVGIKLSGGILEEIVDAPTFSYLAHYRQANFKLDRITFDIGSYFEKKGIETYAVPASQIIDWKNSLGLISHKVFAYLSGLAFHGINNLAVNPQFGSRVRWATIFIKAEGKIINKLLDSDCSTCLKCIQYCPALAIGKNISEFNLSRCKDKLNEFIRERKTTQHICGICLKACHGNY